MRTNYCFNDPKFVHCTQYYIKMHIIDYISEVKKYKRTNNDLQNIHIKLKIE
jgi:hypothetical protein